MPIPSRTRERRLVRDVVYEQFRDGIVSGELAPGARLDDGWLQQWLGASRTPIREAVGRLSREGLLDVRPQRGTHVAPLDATSSIEQLRVLRTFVLAAAAEIIPRRDPALDAELDRHERALDVAADAGPVWLNAAISFVHGYGNRLLARITGDLEPHVRRAVLVGTAAGAFESSVRVSLQAALRAARAGDVVEATGRLSAFFDGLEHGLQAALQDGGSE